MFKVPTLSNIALAIICALFILILSGYLPNIFFTDYSAHEFNPDEQIVLGRV